MKERGGLLSSGSRSTHVFAPWRRREASLKYDSLPRRFPLSLSLSSFFRDFEAPGANGRGEAEVLRSSLLNRGGHLGEGKYSPSLWEIPSIWMPGVYGGFTLLDITKKRGSYARRIGWKVWQQCLRRGPHVWQQCEGIDHPVRRIIRHYSITQKLIMVFFHHLVKAFSTKNVKKSL